MGISVGKVAWLVGLVLLCVGLVGLALKVEEADAATRPQLTTLWTVVNQGGHLVRDKGATSAVRKFQGWYEVSFNRKLGAVPTPLLPLTKSVPL